MDRDKLLFIFNLGKETSGVKLNKLSEAANGDTVLKTAFNDICSFVDHCDDDGSKWFEKFLQFADAPR